MDKPTLSDQFKDLIDEGVSKEELVEILTTIPDIDDQDPSFLELAARCILEVSSLVDDTYSELNRRARLIKKYSIMSKLLAAKVQDLAASN
jgi:flagellar biosynthesis component FlhA